MVIAIDGLSLGAIYALIALGYTMVYGIAKMLNFAHGDVIMVGAYMIYTLCTLTWTTGSLPIWAGALIAFVVSIVVCTLLGMVNEKVAYKPLRGASPLAALITAIGVSYLLQGIAQLIWGAEYMQNYGNIVTVHIRNLRQKIEDDPQRPSMIKTVWGKGYRFVEKNE